MKYAHIDDNNKLLGWYDPAIHTDIPEPNIEILDEQWQIAINNNHNKVNEDGTTEHFDFRTAEEIEAQEIARKVAEAKAYLVATDHKVLPDYEPKEGEDLEDITAKRSEARAFVRENKA